MYLKKLNQLSNTEQIFQLLLNYPFVLKKHCKMQNKFSNIYIIIKIIYMYIKYTLLSNTEQMLK